MGWAAAAKPAPGLALSFIAFLRSIMKGLLS
jgi:hypothetical protein